MADADNKDINPPAREPNFWDSMWGMGFLVAAILLARFYILEPFKIPSGSMEPTLIGHEDFGDRIVTNKLAFVNAKQAMFVMACSAALILVGFIISKGWKRKRSIAFTILLFLGVVGGIGFEWSQGAVAGEPQRFDVTVFHYNDAWTGNKPQEINYIKRLIGLPGETILISGGDLYLRKLGKYEIIRKPDYRETLQQTLWFPVSKAWSPQVHESPKDDNPAKAEINATLAAIKFPWKFAQPEMSAHADVGPKSLVLKGSGAVALEYPYKVTNIYLKQGRWPFKHLNCPEANKPGIQHPDGGVIRNPENLPREITAYVTNTWEGVQCPNCKQILFPIVNSNAASQSGPWIIPAAPKFFYGGDQNVGDLKLELDIDVESGGEIKLEAGSNQHLAVWNIGGSAAGGDSDTVHPVQKSTPALSPGRHSLSLAYVDATVIATLDGQQIEKRPIDVTPPGNKANALKSIARMTFTGTKGTVSKLNLWRDLYYTSTGMSAITRGKQRGPDGVDEGGYLRYLEEGGFVAEIDKDGFLMFGDNSPGSSDSRVWGTVPRNKLIGRASFVWWPPSRWRLIK